MTVKHTLVSSDMRVFALCSLMELHRSISSTFLNKAADDAKNRRSVLSYLRGAQKDGSFNREDQDFCSQIVLEIKDTGKNTHTCIGVSFEVGKADTDIRKHCFFSHSGKIPEDEYLTEEGVPYTIAKLKKLVEARIESADNRGRGDVNRVYPSKEAYLKTVYDAIFGYVEPGRMMTMEKSAIALRMTNGSLSWRRSSRKGCCRSACRKKKSLRTTGRNISTSSGRYTLLSDLWKGI